MILYKTIITLLALSFLYAPLSFSADAVSFDPRPIVIEAKSSGGVPVGTIIAWPVATNPEDAENWLECNGQSTTGYDELAAIVGANVPDYRGLFLRGYGQQSIIQNNGSIIGNTNTTHSSGNLRDIQGDATRKLGETTMLNSYLGLGSSGTFRNVRGGLNPVAPAQHYMVYYQEAYLELERTLPTANEIRPVNTAVRYLIRAVK